MHRRPISKAVAPLLVCFFGLLSGFDHSASADIPRDPRDTLAHVRGGRIRVGLVQNRPWAFDEDGEPRGIEVELVKKLAAELGATPDWRRGGEQGHMEALERYELDLVIGGLTKSTPWKKTVGLTHSYFEDHVMATAPGENAWIKRLDEFLAAHGAQAARSSEQQQP